MRAADGKLWFPTMGGIAVINPGGIRLGKEPPPAIIEEVRLAGKPTDLSRGVTVQLD